MQSRVLIIFASKEDHGIESLEDRRIQLLDSFTDKILASSIYSERWLSRKDKNYYGTRNEEEYKIERPRTLRMQMNPLNYIRRRLNDNRLMDHKTNFYGTNSGVSRYKQNEFSVFLCSSTVTLFSLKIYPSFGF